MFISLLKLINHKYDFRIKYKVREKHSCTLPRIIHSRELSDPRFIRILLYEFVAKLESVDSDYEYFLKKIGLSLDVLGNFPSAYESTAMDYNNYVERLVTFFNIFSKEDMELLCEIYSVLSYNLLRQM